MAANLIFSHPAMDHDLGILVSPNEIEWSYGLNVANFPTYGGEVIQILSAYIEDMTISGNVESYRQLEDIYSWFIVYAQIATTGIGTGKFNVEPVQMWYSPRSWHFQVYPTGAPGFKYSRETVAPEWTLKCSVVDPAQDAINAVMDQAAIEAATNKTGEPALFGKATGEIGFVEHNPFSDPEGDEGELGKKNREKFLGGEKVKQGIEQLADNYNKLLPAYLEGNFEDLTADYSRPVSKLAKEAEEKVPKKEGQKAKAGKK